VFLNLLQNAAEAIEGTGIILVASRLNGRLAEIRIEDDGPGIPDELLDKIFDPFFTTKREGTGLGLPICRNIVQDHGGELIVQSERGRGAVLLIRLPVHM
jgi:signal transduction histidine kinase